MKQTNLTILLDCLFSFLGLGLILLCILRYYGIALLPSVLASTLFSFSLTLPLGYYLFRRRSKTYLKRRDEEEKQKLMLHLTLLPDEKVLELLAQTIETEYSPTKKTVKTEECRYIPRFTMQPLSADEVVKLIKSYAKEKIAIWVNEATAEAKTLAERLNCHLIEGSEVYLALKQRNLLPESYILGEKSKRTPKEKAERYFAKGNSGSFFRCGVGLLLLSFFTFFPIYYIVIGSVLVLFSIGVKWLGYRIK